MRAVCTSTRTFLLSALLAGAAGAGADHFAFWQPTQGQGDFVWSNSAKWGLDNSCNLHPHNGMPICCDCQPEDRWHAVINVGQPTVDVNPTIVGLLIFEGDGSLMQTGSGVGQTLLNEGVIVKNQGGVGVIGVPFQQKLDRMRRR